MATTVSHTLLTVTELPVARATVSVRLGGVINGVWQPVSGFTANGELISAGYQQTDQTGAYSLDLIGNDQITPANTSYQVTHPGGEQLYISVPSSGGPYTLESLLTTQPPTLQPVYLSPVVGIDGGDAASSSGGYPVIDGGTAAGF